jgi:2-polyprenyl-3-methyl-5-hydroxy-6-metoxy-1,4-benzoquinol methylase
MSHGHNHGHDHGNDHAQVDDAAAWDRMWAHRATKPWDPTPNPVLAEVAAGLPTGSALDVGCGEGASALWLAGRGWQLTAFDHSEVALERARAADPDETVAWRLTDMHEAAPVVGAYDLVSALHLHIPPAARPAFFGGLAAAVRPGGTLAVVARRDA